MLMADPYSLCLLSLSSLTSVYRYLRDVRVHQILEGTNQVMNLIISRQVLKD